jgi:hypothetical protein
MVVLPRQIPHEANALVRLFGVGSAEIRKAETRKMRVADLISILQQQNPQAIAVIPSPAGGLNPLKVLKVEPRDVTPAWLVGQDRPGLDHLWLADSDATGAMPGLYLGDTNAVPALVTGARLDELKGHP